MRQQAKTGEIVLLFADESEVRTHPYLAHMWMKRGEHRRIEAPGQSKKRAILGVRDASTAKLMAVTSDTKRSEDFIDLLELLDRHYAAKAEAGGTSVVLVLDNASIHKSRVSTQALAARTWLRVEWLPKYASELNDIERDWRHLKRHYLANQSFRDVDDLDRRIHAAIAAVNKSRARDLCALLPICDLLGAAPSLRGSRGASAGTTFRRASRSGTADSIPASAMLMRAGQATMATISNPMITLSLRGSPRMGLQPRCHDPDALRAE